MHGTRTSSPVRNHCVVANCHLRSPAIACESSNKYANQKRHANIISQIKQHFCHCLQEPPSIEIPQNKKAPYVDVARYIIEVHGYVPTISHSKLTLKYWNGNGSRLQHPLPNVSQEHAHPGPLNLMGCARQTPHCAITTLALWTERQIVLWLKKYNIVITHRDMRA